MTLPDAFEQEKQANIQRMGQADHLLDLTHEWFLESCRYGYSYNFSWMGLPVIQYPQDMMAMQEIIWRTRPDLIIETGIARGGSLVFYASMLDLLGSNGRVVGIDIDIRAYNRAAIEAHPMFKRITMLEGSSIDPVIVAAVTDLARSSRRVLVVLDSMHTHDHVLQELQHYAPLVTCDSYLVVYDTVVEHMPKEEFFPDRSWGPGNNPKTAVQEFLKTNDRFIIDTNIQNKLLITVAPDGYLRCTKD